MNGALAKASTAQTTATAYVVWMPRSYAARTTACVGGSSVSGVRQGFADAADDFLRRVRRRKWDRKVGRNCLVNIVPMQVREELAAERGLEEGASDGKPDDGAKEAEEVGD